MSSTNICSRHDPKESAKAEFSAHKSMVFIGGLLGQRGWSVSPKALVSKIAVGR